MPVEERVLEEQPGGSGGAPPEAPRAGSEPRPRVADLGGRSPVNGPLRMLPRKATRLHEVVAEPAEFFRRELERVPGAAAGFGGPSRVSLGSCGETNAASFDELPTAVDAAREGRGRPPVGPRARDQPSRTVPDGAVRVPAVPVRLTSLFPTTRKAFGLRGWGHPRRSHSLARVPPRGLDSVGALNRGMRRSRPPTPANTSCSAGLGCRRQRSGNASTRRRSRHSRPSRGSCAAAVASEVVRAGTERGGFVVGIQERRSASMERQPQPIHVVSRSRSA